VKQDLLELQQRQQQLHQERRQQQLQQEGQLQELFDFIDTLPSFSQDSVPKNEVKYFFPNCGCAS
jgi:hypothetical protein